MLLAASRFNVLSWKQNAINQAKKISEGLEDPYLHICIAQRESSLLRMNGETTKSYQVIGEFHASITLPDERAISGDARWSSKRGELVHSCAENLIQSGELNAARDELLQWNPINAGSPSPMERIVLRSKSISLGRILRTQGHFRDALNLLQATYEESEADEIDIGGWRRVLLSNIGELHCELEQSMDAQRLLLPELEKMRIAGSQNISSGRRLQLTLAEAFLRDGLYGKAEEILYNVRSVLGNIDAPDMIARRAIFRAWANLARIAHLTSQWDKALFYWNNADGALKVLGRQTGSQRGIVQFSIAFALFKTARIQDSVATKRIGQKNLSHEGRRRYWIVGLDSYWRDYITECVNQSIPD